MKSLRLFPAAFLIALATTNLAQPQSTDPPESQKKPGNFEATRESSAEIISDHLELLLTSTQGWGELGVNVAAHLPNQPALPLQIGDRRFIKGLGSHAPGEIVLLLDQQYSRFEASIGVQRQPGDCGSVGFKVLADGKEVFKSGKMEGHTPAQSLSVAVDGVEELRLVSTDAEDGITCDLADWANARLIPVANASGIHPAATRVDMSPFARVATWDPARMDGARASRIQEFRAEDLFTETELKPKRDGSYVVPVWANGVGCIGLQWLNRRALRELVLEFADPSPIPAPDSIRIEGWFGESAWQGNWKPLTNEWQREDRRLICKLAPRAGMIQTRKIRWILPAAPKPLRVRLSAFTRSSWATTNLFVQVDHPKPGARGKLIIWNGESLNKSEIRNPKSEIVWRLSKPLQLAVRYSRPSSLKSDPTVLQFQLPAGNVAVSVEDVLANDCVYLPDFGLFVARILPRPVGEGRSENSPKDSRIAPLKLVGTRSTRVPNFWWERWGRGGTRPYQFEREVHGGGERTELRDASASPSPNPLPQGRGFSLPVTLPDYKQSIAGKKTVLEEVRAMPDQTLAQAMARTHHEAQREGPVLLSLAGDNTKFQVDRNGSLSCLVYTNAAVTTPDTRLHLKPTFGDGKSTNLTRSLDGGWLPIPVIEVENGGVTYHQRSFVAPFDDPGDQPARLNRRSVCVVEFTATNASPNPADASLSLTFGVPGQSSLGLIRKADGWQLAVAGQRLGFIATHAAAPLNVTVEETMMKLAGSLPAHSASRCVVFLPAEENAPVDSLSIAELQAATEAYWKAVLAPAMQVETPDPLLNNVIRSSQVRCWIDARSEAGGTRVAAWIAAVSYGPLESESHSVIRGMDFLGNDEFARRALDFFIHRYNAEGFLTTGYTTFGTAWHLWTVGEHYKLTRDTNWLRQIAPEVARVGHWIVRQTEKTKKLDAYGRRVPEYGLMPPGVLADWNAFAYHFTMNAYYVAALREIGHALSDIHHPDARFFLKQAEELRANTLRAYAWTQARAPALALGDGTWVPDYPSQVHSPGNLADFFPGEDAGRSWCYNVELGAHQLVPAGVLEPRSREVTRMMNHMEDVQFLADGWFDYPATMNHADWFDNGGFSKVQPYYSRNCEIYAMRDDVKPFVRSYFNTLAAMLNPEVLTMWEHFHHSGAWDKTHETGYFLQQTHFMLATEHGQELWLAPLITSNWLKDSQTVSVANLPTTFGKVSFRITSHVNDGCIEAHVEPPTRSTPKALVLRLRHPDGKPMRSVTVNGKKHTDFDSHQETITLPRGSQPLEVRAEF